MRPDPLAELVRIAKEFATPEALKRYLEEHPGADRRNHSIKKDNGGELDTGGQDLSGMRGHLRDDLDRMPTKFLGKDEGYNHPAVKAKVKTLKKLPLTQVKKQFAALGDLRRKVDQDYTPGEPGDSPKEKQRAQIHSLWRAYSAAVDEMEEEARERSRGETGFGKYLPPAELKKRRRMSPDISKKLKDWEGTGSSDPVHKVLEEDRKDDGYVRMDKVEKAIQYLERLKDDPHHKEDAPEINGLVKELGTMIGRRASWEEFQMSVKTSNHEVISGRDVLRRAVLNDLISPEEARSRKFIEAADEAASYVNDMWPEGEGFGSSDMTSVVESMLRNAGEKIAYKGGRLVRLARFTKGEPADPTANMTPEAAAKWKSMNEEYRDKFKKTAATKKKITDWMWVLSKDSTGGYIVTLGDPGKPSSKIKVRFSDKDTMKSEIKNWVKDNVGKAVSPNHVIDLTGLRLVPDTWDDEFVDSLSEKQKKTIMASEANLSHLARNLPKDVERYVEEVKKGNPKYDDAKVWATAWSIWCKYKAPGDKHCQRNPSEYFLSREASEDPLDTLTALADPECAKKYKNDDGTFKGRPGERFDNCVEFMTDCRDDVDDPDALCAWIGREQGKIAGHHEDGGKWYVDTAFINAVPHVYPGAELHHMGFGEFYLDTPDGRIDFDRELSKDFEGQSGRSHLMTDNAHGKAVEKAVKLMEQRNKSDRMAKQELKDMTKHICEASVEDALDQMTILAAKYPWNQCIKDQIERYGDKETAEKVCGKIKAISQGGGKTASNPIGKGKNGYIALYKGKKVEVMADTTFEAQTTAAAYFKAKKTYEVDVVLAEKDGKPVAHKPLMASVDPLVEMTRLATWETGYRMDDDPREHEGEGSLIPGLEEKRAFFPEVDDNESSRETASALPGDAETNNKKGRFEEGQSADPTENMSPEDAKRWREEHEKHKNEFKTASGDPLAEMAKLASEKASRFEEGEDADPTKGMSPEDAKKWREMNEAHRDKFKTALSDREARKMSIEEMTEDMSEEDADKFHENIQKVRDKAKAKKAEDEPDEKRGRFEEGVSADPTKDMSPEDAAKWKEEHDKHKDEFKKGASVKPGAKIKSEGVSLTIKKVVSDSLVIGENPEGHLVLANLNEYTGKWDSLEWFKGDEMGKAEAAAKKRAKKASDDISGFYDFETGKFLDGGLLYFGLHGEDFNVEEDLRGDNGRDRQEEAQALFSGKDMGDVWADLERQALKEMQRLLGKTVNNEGHASDGDLICKVYVESYTEFQKLWGKLRFSSEDELALDTPYFVARDFHLSLDPGIGKFEWDWEGRTRRRESIKDFLRDYKPGVGRQMSSLGSQWGQTVFASRPATGLYGYSQRVQADCESGTKKVAKVADEIARKAFAKDERLGAFLAAHHRRAQSLPARVLMAALRNMGPKFASATKKADLMDEDTLYQLIDLEAASLWGSDRGDFEVTNEVEQAAKKFDAATKKELLAWIKKNNYGEFDLTQFSGNETDPDEIVNELMEARGGASFLYFMELEGHGIGTWDGDWDHFFVNPKRTLKELSSHMKSKLRDEYSKLKRAIEDAANAAAPEDEDEGKKAARMASKGHKYGLYGYSTRTAEIGLKAMAELRGEVGKIAADLHSKHGTEGHRHIRGFLGCHSNQANCLYSSLLRASYPSAKTKCGNSGCAEKKVASEPLTVDEWLKLDL